MKPLICLPLALLSGCTLFGALSEEEEKMLKQHRAGAGKYFDAHQYEKSIAQARKGLELATDDYRLTGVLAWAHLQLSTRPRGDNEEHLFKAQAAFEDLIGFRDIEDHDPKNIFGFAIALHNWGRVEEHRSRRIRREVVKAKKDDRKTMLALASEYDRMALHKDAMAKSYFLKVVDGSFSQKGNTRESYKYLMAIEYRYDRVNNAIAYGTTCLELNAEEVKYWQQEYQRTKFAGRERQIRRDLASLKTDELKVHSRLAAYFQEKAQVPDNKDFKKDYAAAKVHLDAILPERINSSEDYYLRATCHRALGNHDDARKDYKMFLSLGKLTREHDAVKDAEEYLYGKGK